MLLLNNYFFTDISNKDLIVVPEVIYGNYKGDACICGYTEDNKFIISRKVTYVSEGIVITDGENYNTGVISKDYLGLYCAIINDNIPIIENWEFDRIPKDTYIRGKCNGKEIYKKIILQNDNYLKLDDGITYFLNWSSMSAITKKRIILSSYHSYFKKISYFCNIKCKIIL